MPGDLYKLYAIAFTWSCVSFWQTNIQCRCSPEPSFHTADGPLYLVLLMICLNFACRMVGGLLFAALRMILSLKTLYYNACLLAAEV